MNVMQALLLNQDSASLCEFCIREIVTHHIEVVQIQWCQISSLTSQCYAQQEDLAISAQFVFAHDESTFYANADQTRYWCDCHNQLISQNDSMRQLLHVNISIGEVFYPPFSHLAQPLFRDRQLGGKTL